MPLINSFSEFSTHVAQEFLEQGYTVQSCENLEGLQQLRQKMAEWFCENMDLPAPDQPEPAWFDMLHEHVFEEQINESRMHCYTRLNAEPWARPTYFSFARVRSWSRCWVMNW